MTFEKRKPLFDADYIRNQASTAPEVQWAQLYRQLLQLFSQNKQTPYAGGIPPVLFGTVKAPFVNHPKFEQVGQKPGAVTCSMSWESPVDPNIGHFNIFARHQANRNEQWSLVGASAGSPAEFVIKVDENTAVVFAIQTVMKNGYGSPIAECPTVTAQVTVDTSQLDFEPAVWHIGSILKVGDNNTNYHQIRRDGSPFQAYATVKGTLPTTDVKIDILWHDRSEDTITSIFAEDTPMIIPAGSRDSLAVTFADPLPEFRAVTFDPTDEIGDLLDLDVIQNGGASRVQITVEYR